MKLMITAFEPFGGDAENAAALTMEALPDSVFGFEICKVLLPTVFGAAADKAVGEAKRIRPDAIVCLGQAGGRNAVTPERTAVNVMNASRPDNAGNRPEDEPVVPGGPAAYFSTLPVRSLADAIRAAGIPAAVSESAGTYVCNSVMYAMLHYVSEAGLGIPCGFIHLPYLDVQACAEGTPVISRDDAVRAVRTAVGVLAEEMSA